MKWRWALLLLAIVGTARAVEPAYDEKAALAKSQAAIGRALTDHRFVDSDGRAVALSQFRGKPLVLSLVYTSCYHTCPVITQHVGRTTDIARQALGADSFQVVTLGFDSANDTPERMRSFARERGIDTRRWRMLSADAATMKQFAAELGFIYFPSPRGFDHLAQTTVIDAEGRVYRQVYGDSFPPPTLVEPLKDLVFGRHSNLTSVSGVIAGVKLFCTVFDPKSGRYRFDYSIFVAFIIGVVSLGAVAVFIVRAWREGRARN